MVWWSVEASCLTGLERLCKAVAAAPVESVLTNVMGQLIGDNPPGDDIAVLALRRHPNGEIGARNEILSAAERTATQSNPGN
jgi:hypothetical protein